MFQTIGRSFRLAKLCLHVLSVDKELVMFPVFSSIGVVLVLLSFGGVGLGIGALNRIEVGRDWHGGDIADRPRVLYPRLRSSSSFFNSALVYAAHERLAGGDPNIRSGLKGSVVPHRHDLHVGRHRRYGRVDTEHTGR